MLKLRKKYSPGTCDYKEKYHEIRWDLSGCNLRCHFCWSAASRPAETGDPSIVLTTEEIVNKTIDAITLPSKTFIRFTGGEPTLQWKGIKDVIESINKAGLGYKIPILIQTNGIEIGKGNVDTDILRLDNTQPFLFELSFKGTNSHEFELLTGRDGSLFRFQLNAYDILKALSKSHKNIAVVAVLGVYHSSVRNNSKYAFLDQTTGRLLFEDLSSWAEQFKHIWLNAPLKWVEPLRMSPKGVWENLINRYGENGVGILKYFPNGVQTNKNSFFPPKPKSFQYAEQMVGKKFWREEQKLTRIIVRKRKG